MSDTPTAEVNTKSVNTKTPASKEKPAKVETAPAVSKDYAIVSTGGEQLRVSVGDRVTVQLTGAKKGAVITWKSVLGVSRGGSFTVGAPTVAGASVTAKVLGTIKDDKVIIFKKNRRTGYQKKQGHRQLLTEVVVQSL